MKRRRIIILTLVIIVVIIAILSIILSDNDSQKLMKLAPIVDEILDMEGVADCRIVELNEYDDIKVYIGNTEISQQELENSVDECLRDYGQNELTDDFVSTNFECESVEQYLQELEQNLLEAKKIQMIVNARKQILKQLFERAKFYINEDEIIEYSLGIIKGYEEEAYIYNMSIQEYVENILGISYDEFFEKCYEESETIIKTYLVMGVIADRIGLDSKYDENTIYAEYQKLENDVYSLFIAVDDEF